jgi:DNA-binding NtrC family response regulator
MFRAKILVIEDNQSQRLLLEDILSSEGYQVSVYARAPEALAHFKPDGFDFVVTDLELSELSGWEVAQKVKEIDPAVNVILVTGWAPELTPEELKIRGIDFLLLKPFRIKEILSTLEEAFKSRLKKA